MTCLGCQERLLEYVYGLLEVHDPENATTARELQEHLEGCANCQAAHRRALQQKQLIAQASRISSDIRFHPPEVVLSTPVTSQKTRAKKPVKQSTVAWYVTAATLFIALLAGSSGAYWWGIETKWKPVEVARGEIERMEQQPVPVAFASSKAEKTLADLQQQLVGLRQAWKGKEDAALAKARSESTYLQVIATPSAETDNRTNLLVVQQSLDNKPQAIKKLDVKILDEIQQPVNEQSYQNTNLSNQYAVTLPTLAYRDIHYTVQVQTDSGGLSAPSKLSYQLQALRAEYIAHLVIDKPLYQPGDSVFYRALALEKATFRPVKEELDVKFTLLDPDGKPLFSRSGKAQLRENVNSEQVLKDVMGKPIQGIAASEYRLPATAPAGEYTLRVEEIRNRFAPQQARFLVNKAAAPRFNKDLLRFSKLSYSPGETVELLGKIKVAAENRPWPNGLVAASVLIDGQYYDDQGKPSRESYTLKGATDSTGMLRLQFRLPKEIQHGQAVVGLKLDRDALDLAETWTLPLGIVLQRPTLEFFPEGGDLIAGVPNRIYFMMRNAQGEPIDGQAELLDEAGVVIAKINTFRDETKAGSARGMGWFSFTPKPEDNYLLAFPQITKEKFLAALPPIKSGGLVLHVEDTVLTGSESIRVQLQNVAPARDLLAAVYCRGQLLGAQTCKAPANGQETLDIPISSSLGGVYRITIFALQQDQRGPRADPVAERLLYRQPNQSLELQLSAQPISDHQVNLKIVSKTEQQKPTPAYLTVVGVNQALLSLADDKTARQLPTHFLLAQEVREPEELEQADFFLSDHPVAKKALDLLLGVQGWRRFKEVDQLPIVAANNEQLNRWNEAKPVIYDNRQEVLNSIEEEVHKKLPQTEAYLYQQIKGAEQSYQETKKTAEVQKERMLKDQKEFQHARASLETRFIIAEKEWQQFGNWYWLAVAGMLMSIAIFGSFLICLNRKQLPRHLFVSLIVVSLATLAVAGYFLLVHFQHLDSGTRLVQKPIQPKDVNETLHLSTSKEAKEPMSPPAGAPQPKWNPKKAEEKSNLADRPKAADAGEHAKSSAESSTESKPVPEKATNEFNGARRRSIPEAPAGSASTPPLRSLDVKERESAKMPRTDNPSTIGRDQTNVSSIPKNDVVSKFANNKNPAQPTANSQAAYQRKNLQNEKLTVASTRIAGTLPAGKTKDATADKEETNAPAKGSSLKFSGGGLGGGGIAEGGLGGSDSLAAQPSGLPFFVREYGWKRGTQPDNLKATPWSQALYWNPLVVVPSGETTILLEVPQSDGTYRISVFGHGGDGRLGAASMRLQTPVHASPLSLETRLSTEIAKQGDHVQLAVTLENKTMLRQNRVIAKINLPDGVNLPPNFKLSRSSNHENNSEEFSEPSSFSVKGKELTISWDELPVGKKVRIVFTLICQKSGSYKAAPSRAYLENLEKQAITASPLEIFIDPP